MKTGGRLRILWLAAVLHLAAAPAALAQVTDDVVLFTANVTPNVLLLLDNSESMSHIVWHPDFDPSVTPTCTAFDNGLDYTFNNDSTETHCSRTRTIFTDSKVQQTMYDGRYLNWIFSPEADEAYKEIEDGDNGFPSSCVGGNAFAKYQRSRLTTAKQAIKDIVCEVNLTSSVRFGLATFREAEDPNGGYVRLPVEEFNSEQASDFDSALQSIKPDQGTPLGESLFQLYTYFMSRTATDLPVGNDGVTSFPLYSYSTSKSGTGGKFESDPSKVPPSPVQYSCQKNFVILVTDGDPTRDDFDVESPIDTALGFSDFQNLIGDFNADGETEVQDDAVCEDCESAFYLDDVALYMQTNDFRPDMNDDQVIDTYAVGFVTGPTANSLLQKTAAVGNGLFRQASTSDQLAAAIVDAFVDIIEKSQSFTAATVPATRTASGGNLYTSLFIPSGKTPYWEGHLQNYQISQQGEILDKNGDCAVDDPNPGECFSGPFLPDAVPFWDAGKEIPDPAQRDLYTSILGGSGTTRTPFDKSLTAADLEVVYPPAESYPGSTATNAEGLTTEIIQNIRGCEFGTGTSNSSNVDNPQACVTRPWLLGAIFHSNPVVVGPPAAFLSDQNYDVFAQRFGERDRVIYAGANDGFLRAFLAGVFDANAGTYDRGTGEELFGFMPWPGRLAARKKPIDTGTRDEYFVDGSPTVADVWIHDSATDATKECGLSDTSACEWKTVLMSGMRQGGEAYFALDVTDPSDSAYPELLWEFPAEDAAASLQDFVGETWSEPIITRVRVESGSNPAAERWVAIFGGGYHETGDPNRPTSYSATGTEGRAIFMVELKTGEVLAAKKFDAAAAAGDPEGEMLYAIPSTPAVFDLDFDGFADVVYVGDLGGNMWKWVIHPVGEDPINDGTASTDQPNWPFRKFFQAPTYDDGTQVFYKSFFFPPAGTFRNGKLWVAFGTGERANLTFEGDPGTTDDNNRFYAMLDLDPFEVKSPPFPTLEEDLDTDNNGLVDLLDVTATGDPTNLTGYRGYYFIAAEGEKFVTNVDIFFHFVITSSYIPTESTDPCETGGESFLYAFRIYNGEGFFEDENSDPERSFYLGAGLPTDPRVTISSDGSDASNRVIINKQDGDIVNLQAPPGLGAGIGQFYWRERSQ